MRTITYREALNEALTQELDRDPRVFVFGLDADDHNRIFGTTAGLVERFGPQRCFSTPLSEEAMTGVALGAAINGLRPIHVHIRVDFALIAMNQIVNMLSNYRYLSGGSVTVPVVIRAVIGRGWGQGAQHSKSLHALFGHIPGLKVVMPTTPADAKGLLVAAIRDDNPVIVLEHRWLYDITGEVPEDPDLIVPLGEPHRVRSGDDLTVVATSWMNVEALKAAEVMARIHDVSVEIIDPRTIAPLNDELIIDSVNKTGRCIIADYDWLHCGFSAEVAARISAACFDTLKAPVVRLGFAATPCPTTRQLENLFYPNAVDIIRKSEDVLGLVAADLSDERFYSYEHKFKGPF